MFKLVLVVSGSIQPGMTCGSQGWGTGGPGEHSGSGAGGAGDGSAILVY